MSTNIDLEDIEELAYNLLKGIQTRTAHVVSQMQQMIAVLLNEKIEEDSPLKTDTITRTLILIPTLTIEEIEENHSHWATQIPDAPEIIAALWNLLSEEYSLDRNNIPEILRILRYEDAKVQQAFKVRIGKPIDSIFSSKKKNPLIPQSKDKKLSPVAEDLIHRLEWITIKRGEPLFRQGDEGNGIYIVADGLFHIVMERDGEEVYIGQSGRNEILGEIALITNNPRSATVYAVRDSQVCRLSTSDFDDLSQKHDVLRSLVIRQVVERIQNPNTNTNKFYSIPHVITILPLSSGIGDFGQEFAKALGRHIKVLFLDRGKVTQRLTKDIMRALDTDEHQNELSAWLKDKEIRHDFIVYQADEAYTPWTENCLQRAERILLVGLASEDPGLTQTEDRILNSEKGKYLTHQELILLHEPNSTIQGTADWLIKRDVKQHHHIHIGDMEDMARLTRLLFSNAAGLVLGGGGLRGAAHAGAYRVIEKLGIPIDAIGGTSAGAIAGALFAMGKQAKEALSTTRDILLKRRTILDFTLPIVGLNSARRITHAFDMIFGDIQIEDLPIPFFCTSTNINTASINFHSTGSLAKYIRASTSLPGIYPPVIEEDGTLLVDGGVLDNLPIKHMQDLTNGGRIIAVDVGRQVQDTNDYAYRSYISGWHVLWSILNPLKRKISAPNIVETITKTSMLASQIEAEKSHNLADVIIRPNVSHIGLFDVAATDLLYREGRKAAQATLGEWLSTKK